MTPPTTHSQPHDPSASVSHEISSALERLAKDMPTEDAGLILRMAIGHLAGIHARSFGHAATVKTMIAIARRGLWSASEEMLAPRN